MIIIIIPPLAGYSRVLISLWSTIMLAGSSDSESYSKLYSSLTEIGSRIPFYMFNQVLLPTTMILYQRWTSPTVYI